MGVNVNFKRGTHQNLMALATGAGYVDGTFYLTTDTNRLYFCQGSSLVDLNQYIHMTSDVTLNDIENENLPKTSTTGYSNLQQGDIYYWSNLNILAICDNPSTGRWTQLNPDTYLEANLQHNSFVNGTNQVTVNTTVKDAPKGNESKGSFTIAGSSNVTVSQSGGVITIESVDTTANYAYSLGAQASSTTGTGILKLTGSNGGSDSSVNIVGTGSVEVSVLQNGDIQIDGSGVDSIAPKIDSNGGLYINYNTTSGNTSSNAITPTVLYGENAATTATFVGGQNVSAPALTLDVYTQAEVDSLISAREAALNAMKYAGTVSNSDFSTKIVAAPVNGVGTTYKASAPFTLPNPDGREVNTGDLLIANGTDDEHVTWDIVPSGDDQVITGGASGNGIWVSDQSSATPSTAPSIAGLTVNGSTSTFGTISVTNNISGNSNVLTVAHGAAGTGSAVTIPAATTATTLTYTTAETPISIPVITGIEKDAAGHITTATAATYVINDTHNYITSLTIGASATSSTATTDVATINIRLDDYDNNTPKQASFNLASDNLEITSTSANGVYTVNANYVWGTF